ncbi:MAG TPA: hypothetical protein VKB79_21375 [Bryobacteraceae bacterium]|nr:hypothetical protein [Bryobacteraceae bacterium]
MRNMTAGRMVRIAGLVIGNAISLFSSSLLYAADSAALEPSVNYTTTSETTSGLKVRSASAQTNAAPAESTAQAEAKAAAAVALLKQAPLSVEAAAAAAVKDMQKNGGARIEAPATPTTTAKTASWFNAGPTSFPMSARVDPTFGLPINQYGAGPTSVSFSFGK